nr:hypothetical protein [Halobaculum gomorrense]
MALAPERLPESVDDPATLAAGVLLQHLDPVADGDRSGVDHVRADAAASALEGPGDARLAGDLLDVGTRRSRAGAAEHGARVRVAETERRTQQVVKVDAADDDVAGWRPSVRLIPRSSRIASNAAAAATSVTSQT